MALVQFLNTHVAPSAKGTAPRRETASQRQGRPTRTAPSAAGGGEGDRGRTRGGRPVGLGRRLEHVQGLVIGLVVGERVPGEAVQPQREGLATHGGAPASDCGARHRAKARRDNGTALQKRDGRGAGTLVVPDLSSRTMRTMPSFTHDLP